MFNANKFDGVIVIYVIPLVFCFAIIPVRVIAGGNLKFIMDRFNSLPFKTPSERYFWLAAGITALVIITSLFSVINPDIVYTTNEIKQAYYPSDIGILAFGLPFLLVSLWMLYKGKIIAVVLWPGALFFVLYSYALYLFGIPMGPLFWSYLFISGMSFFSLVRVLSIIDFEKCRTCFAEKTPTRFASIVLLLLGAMIFLRVIGLAGTALINGDIVSRLDIALWITDFIIASPALLVVGIQLWKKTPFAFVAAPGLLLQYMVLSLGLIPVFVYQAGGNMASLDLGGFIVIVFMIAICLIPFVQLMRAFKEK